MGYTIESRISYSEVGTDKCLKLGKIVDYLQDTSTFHSEDLGRGLEYLIERNMAWLMTSWQIVINRRPAHGEKIKVTTWPYDFRNCYGDRNFTIHTEDGELLVYANSLWVLVNTETGHPVRRMPEEISTAYTLEEKIDMEYAPRKIRIKGDHEVLPSFKIQKYQIDSNNHVNNSQYVYMAECCLPADLRYSEIRVEYRNQAVLDDEVIPKIYRQDGRFVVSLDGTEGQVFALIEFIVTE